MKSKYYSNLVFWFFLLSCFGTILFAQSKKDTKLTRKDIIINLNKPTIFLCVDKDKNKKIKITDNDELWLRIYNNTVWTIKFNSQKMGIPTQKLKLSNGGIVGGLLNNSTTYPNYEFE
jgi:hypothetical protein